VDKPDMNKWIRTAAGYTAQPAQEAQDKKPVAHADAGAGRAQTGPAVPVGMNELIRAARRGHTWVIKGR
jgi:hypothetical protein